MNDVREITIYCDSKEHLRTPLSLFRNFSTLESLYFSAGYSYANGEVYQFDNIAYWIDRGSANWRFTSDRARERDHGRLLLANFVRDVSFVAQSYLSRNREDSESLLSNWKDENHNLISWIVYNFRAFPNFEHRERMVLQPFEITELNYSNPLRAKFRVTRYLGPLIFTLMLAGGTLRISKDELHVEVPGLISVAEKITHLVITVLKEIDLTSEAFDKRKVIDAVSRNEHLSRQLDLYIDQNTNLGKR